MSRLGRAIPNIKITASGLGRNETKPLTKPQILSRLDWYGACVPLFQKNKEWLKWAFRRMDELNEMLRTFNAHNPAGNAKSLPA